jgi:hypothetical protein
VELPARRDFRVGADAGDRHYGAAAPRGRGGRRGLRLRE